MTSRSKSPRADTITLAPTVQGMQHRVSSASTAAIETVNRRVNAMGTAESTVVRQGSDRILVQFPGLQDTKQLKDLIGQTAKLSFHAVHPDISAEEAKQTRVPVGYKVYPSAEGEGDAQLRAAGISHRVGRGPRRRAAGLSTRAPTSPSSLSVSISRVPASSGATRRTTSARPFAIVLDNKVLSAPAIREPILGGSGQISGSFTVESRPTRSPCSCAPARCPPS